MDLNEFREIMVNSGVDLWTLIDTAISVASVDHETELKHRRDAIVERLYARQLCRGCDHCRGYDGTDTEKQRMNEEEDEEQKKILLIKKKLKSPDQSEECLVDLLQSLADMDITFKVLEETDIGRHVNQLRKHSSNEVRRLVKLLVRKWKETVDEWVRLNTPPEEAGEGSPFCGDVDSPYQNQTPHRNIQKGLKEERVHVPSHGHGPAGSIAYVTPKREDKGNHFDSEKLGSATKHLHENYQQTQNAKKQRTAQVGDHRNLPKTKNPSLSKYRGSDQIKQR